MTKRRYQPQKDELVNCDGTTTLPTNQPIAVYYRQSTQAQVGNVSTSMQTVDMPDYLVQRGWTRDQIILIDTDEGVSGTTKIDERQGMKRLFQLITEGKIGAVACQDEDRLFRDITQIQVNIFIEACRQNRVLVIVPSMVYDFAHPQMGTFHMRQFRFKSEMAAEHIVSYIRGRLLPAKKRLMMEGRWAGGTAPLGFMIDERRYITDGSKNPNWRRYSVYEPHAEIVREYFRLFVANAGNLRATTQYILENGPYFTDPKTWIAPEGFRFSPSWVARNYGKGYCMGRTGLQIMLTNAAYIGHWAVNDVIVIWDNHQPIVDPDTFYTAFNYLSTVNLDGQVNTNFRGVSFASRPSCDDNRPQERPLCAGLVGSYVGGKWKKAGTSWIGKYQHYGYSVYNSHPYDGKLLWHRKATYLDECVSNVVREKLRSTFDTDVWNRHLIEASHTANRDKILKQKQLEMLGQTMDNLLASLDQLSIPTLISRVQDRYEQAQQEHERLSAELATMESDVARIEALERLKDTIVPVLEKWYELPIPEKRSIIQTLVDRIAVEPLPKQGIQVTINWLDGTQDDVPLPRLGSTYIAWLETEAEELARLYETGASQEDICAAFPKRTWNGIYNKLLSMTGKPPIMTQRCDIKLDETFIQFRERIDSPIAQKARIGQRWRDRDDDVLRNLISSKASQLELAAAFPNRTWKAIYDRIKRLCGEDVIIIGQGRNGSAGQIKRYDTYNLYIERQKGAGQLSKNSLTDVGCVTHPEKVPHGELSLFPQVVEYFRPQPDPVLKWCDAEPGRGGDASGVYLFPAYLQLSRFLLLQGPHRGRVGVGCPVLPVP